MKKMLSVLLILSFMLPYFTARAELKTPEANCISDVTILHVGNTHSWKPFSDYPGLQVSYKSSNPDVLQVSSDGTLTALSAGDAIVTATTAKTEQYAPAECKSPLIYVLSAADGLYLTEAGTYFYYQRKTYASGILPLETERELCLTQPDLKVFLQDYLYPCQAKISDRTEAALTAIINYGANYFKKRFSFSDVGGLAEDSKEDWMRLLVTKKGVCEPCSSLFVYLMYLAGLSSMIVETPKSDNRAHDWNLIEHDGYYYNLENHVFLHHQYDRYIIPPFSNATAAYFPGNIYGCWFMHYPIAGGAFGPNKKVSEMGRDLSKACPIIICEKTSKGDYRVHFETIRQGNLPGYEDGTPVRLEEIIYRNMETGDGEDQFNEEANPLFIKADHMLFREIVGMFNTLVLPESLVTVGADAFENTSAEYVVFPDGVSSIAENALAGSSVRMVFGKAPAVRAFAEKAGLKYVE